MALRGVGGGSPRRGYSPYHRSQRSGSRQHESPKGHGSQLIDRRHEHGLSRDPGPQRQKRLHESEASSCEKDQYRPAKQARQGGLPSRRYSQHQVISRSTLPTKCSFRHHGSFQDHGSQHADRRLEHGSSRDLRSQRQKRLHESEASSCEKDQYRPAKQARQGGSPPRRYSPYHGSFQDHGSQRVDRRLEHGSTQDPGSRHPGPRQHGSIQDPRYPHSGSNRIDFIDFKQFGSINNTISQLNNGQEISLTQAAALLSNIGKECKNRPLALNEPVVTQLIKAISQGG